MALVSNPMRWSASIVSTWLRLWLFALFFIAVIGFMVYQSATYGWRAALGTAIFLAAYQLMLLYALRRLFVAVSEHTAPVLNADQTRQHFTWLLVFIVAIFLFMAFMMSVGRAV
jgi:hypothetical protein